MINQHNPEHVLYKLLAKETSVEQLSALFEDLCSAKELIAFEQRVKVAYLLQKGNQYVEIGEETGASSATISRVRHFCLNNDSFMTNCIASLEKETEEVQEL